MKNSVLAASLLALALSACGKKEEAAPATPPATMVAAPAPAVTPEQSAAANPGGGIKLDSAPLPVAPTEQKQ